VGQLLHRDHSTVLHGDARIRRLAAGEAHVRHDLATLRRYAGAA